MDRWTAALSRPQETSLQAFERSLLDVSRTEIEKNAGELTEYIDTLFDAPAKAPRVDRLLEQTKTAARMGRELAREQSRVKEAGIAGTVMGAIKPMAGKALGWAAQHPQKALAAGGAALGGLAGAATAQPGHRLGGAMAGAGLGAAAGYGATKIPGGYGQRASQGAAGLAARGWEAMGSPKLAGVLSTTLGRAGMGAAAGGMLGALHASDVSRQGMAPAHGLRDTLIGAAGGAALGGALHKMPTGMMGKAEEALAHAPKPGAGMGHNPFSMAAAAHTPEDLRQMSRVRDVARAEDARKAAVRAAQAAPTRPANRPTNAIAGGTMMGKKPVNAIGPTMNMGAPKLAGAAFLKMAFSMSAQAEPGTPGGAQEPEQSDEQILPPSPPAPAVRSASKPAVELFGALKHLSPKLMRGLQVAQPGT